MAMKKLVLSAVLATTAFAQTKEEVEGKPMVGSDRDLHGCIGSAGFLWCEHSQKCIRPWEEECEANNTEDECVDGETKSIDCNSCRCLKGKWGCTKMGCPEPQPISGEKEKEDTEKIASAPPAPPASAPPAPPASAHPVGCKEMDFITEFKGVVPPETPLQHGEQYEAECEKGYYPVDLSDDGRKNHKKIVFNCDEDKWLPERPFKCEHEGECVDGEMYSSDMHHFCCCLKGKWECAKTSCKEPLPIKGESTENLKGGKRCEITEDEESCNKRKNCKWNELKNVCKWKTQGEKATKKTTTKTTAKVEGKTAPLLKQMWALFDRFSGVMKQITDRAIKISGEQ